VLLDATVARSIAMLGWVDQLATAAGGSLVLAHGVLSADPQEPSELRGIRDALQREVQHAVAGSGRQSKAISAVQRMDCFLAMRPPTVVVLMPDREELATAVRLSSRDVDHRQWRTKLGLTARRLDAGEAISIAIAVARDIDFASDDEQALVAYTALADRPPIRSRDAIKLLVTRGLVEEPAGRDGYGFLQEDELHLLGGPAWSLAPG
jgi:hypothetical protein